MTIPLNIGALVAQFGEKETAQDAAEALFAALGHYRPASFVLTDCTIADRERPVWEEVARVMAPHLAGRPEIRIIDETFPLSVAARRMRRPHRWSEMDPDFVNEGHRRLCWETARRFVSPDIDGITVPRFRDGWLVAAVTIGFSVSDWSEADLDLLYSAATAYVERFSREPVIKPVSAREAECLHWTGEGKTDAEIAIILGISAATVRSHLENARMKLGARNRIEAVARHLVATMAEARQGKRVRELSRQEHVVLFRALYGATDEEIALSLEISPATVHRHMENAKRKLGVHTRAQAVGELAKRGGL